MISQEYEGNRTIYNRHGVRIVATCGGSFASWDVFSAFNLFASAGAMIGLATMVVDRLVVRSPFSCEDGVCGFCKYTKFYKSAKYQRTYVNRLAMVAQCPIYYIWQPCHLLFAPRVLDLLGLKTCSLTNCTSLSRSLV